MGACEYTWETPGLSTDSLSLQKRQSEVKTEGLLEGGKSVGMYVTSESSG
jgi:hypothetical protein